MAYLDLMAKVEKLYNEIPSECASAVGIFKKRDDGYLDYFAIYCRKHGVAVCVIGIDSLEGRITEITLEEHLEKFDDWVVYLQEDK